MTDTLGVIRAFAGVASRSRRSGTSSSTPDRRPQRPESRPHRPRRRFMVLGAILLPIFFVLTFAVPPGLGPMPCRPRGCSSPSCSPPRRSACSRCRTSRCRPNWSIRLRRPHPAALGPRHGADLRDPALRRGRAGAAARVNFGGDRVPRLPAHGARSPAWCSSSRSCIARPGARARSRAPGAPAPSRSRRWRRRRALMHFRRGWSALRAASPSAPCSRRSCCRRSRPA